jgi:hypothetical protein
MTRWTGKGGEARRVKRRGFLNAFRYQESRSIRRYVVY